MLQHSGGDQCDSLEHWRTMSGNEHNERKGTMQGYATGQDEGGRFNSTCGECSRTVVATATEALTDGSEEEEAHRTARRPPTSRRSSVRASVSDSSASSAISTANCWGGGSRASTLSSSSERVMVTWMSSISLSSSQGGAGKASSAGSVDTCSGDMAGISFSGRGTVSSVSREAASLSSGTESAAGDWRSWLTTSASQTGGGMTSG